MLRMESFQRSYKSSKIDFGAIGRAITLIVEGFAPKSFSSERRRFRAAGPVHFIVSTRSGRDEFMKESMSYEPGEDLAGGRGERAPPS